MAHPRTVAVRRQNADARLSVAAESASKRFGVPFVRPRTLANRDQALYAAELIENVADFLEKISTIKSERRAS